MVNGEKEVNDLGSAIRKSINERNDSLLLKKLGQLTVQDLLSILEQVVIAAIRLEGEAG